MTLFVRAATVSALLLLAGTPVMAQQPAPPTAPAPTAPAPVAPALAPVAPVPAPDVSPERLAAARAVVVSSGMSRSFEPMASQLEEQIPAVVTRTRPELSKDLGTVMAQLHPEFAKKGDEMVEIAAKIYARSMSEADLKATAAFFESPAGKKYVEAQPIMLDELVVAMQSWTQETSTYMMKRVQAEMEKKGDKF